MTKDYVADVIQMESVSITFTRYTPGTLTLGRPSAPSTATFSALCSVQPIPTRELELMPEGLRARGLKAVFANVELKVLPLPDTFPYLGDTWEVVKVDDWNDLCGYWRAFAARKSIP